MKVVCIQAHGSHRPGDDVDMPDGATWSEVYYAEPGDVQALRAKKDAQIDALAAVNASEAPEPAAEPAASPSPPEPAGKPQKAPEPAQEG